MATLALNIQMAGRVTVIIGGGSVALRKLRILAETGAFIRVVAPTVCTEIADMYERGALDLRTGRYDAADLDSAFLAIAATDDARVNEQVCADARGRGILVTVADNPVAGNCTFPAVLRRGDLEVAVSTGGRCPTFAVAVRDSIAERIGQEYGILLERLAGEREKLLTNGSSSTYNTQVLRLLARRLLAELTEHKESLP